MCSRRRVKELVLQGGHHKSEANWLTSLEHCWRWDWSHGWIFQFMNAISEGRITVNDEVIQELHASEFWRNISIFQMLLAETVLYGIGQCENLAFSPEHVYWLPAHAVTTKDPVLKLDPKKDSISELRYARTVQNWLKTFQDNLAITFELEGQGCCWWEGSLVQMCWKNLGKVIVQPWPSMRPGAEPAHPWWASVGDALQTQGDVINLSTCV